MTIIVGVSLGAPYRRGTGVTVIDVTGAAPGVVEAVTIASDRSLGDAALPVAAVRAVDAGLDMAARAASGAAVVWAIESPSVGTGRGGQQKRAASHRASVQAAQAARLVMQGAVLGAIPAGTPVLTVPSIGDVPAGRCPAALSGPIPRGWRGERGSRREVQRTAWVAAEYARRLLAPATPDVYPSVLAAVIRTARPSPQTLRDVCATALAVVTPPVGAPVLTVDALAHWARNQTLVEGGAA